MCKVSPTLRFFWEKIQEPLTTNISSSNKTCLEEWNKQQHDHRHCCPSNLLTFGQITYTLFLWETKCQSGLEENHITTDRLHSIDLSFFVQFNKSITKQASHSHWRADENQLNPLCRTCPPSPSSYPAQAALTSLSGSSNWWNILNPLENLALLELLMAVRRKEILHGKRL